MVVLPHDCAPSERGREESSYIHTRLPPVGRIAVVTACEDITEKGAIMPIFEVNTNVAKSDVPAALVSEATEELAKALEKPVQVGQGRAYSCRILVFTMKQNSFCPITVMHQLHRFNLSAECNKSSTRSLISI